MSSQVKLPLSFGYLFSLLKVYIYNILLRKKSKNNFRHLTILSVSKTVNYKIVHYQNDLKSIIFRNRAEKTIFIEL